LHHIFYLDGNAQRVSWVIRTKDSIFEQSREHVKEYRDKISNLQSKYIALHIGLFCAIGLFIIKNEDHIKIKLDDKKMFDQLTSNEEITDEVCKNKVKFTKQLITQRKIEIEFELIQQEKNLSKKILDAKDLKTKNG